MSSSDASGKLWLFGGVAYDANGLEGFLNDLWMFDPKLGTNGEWTWMGRNNSASTRLGQIGVYGALGTPASANIPGGRASAVSWSDASGNFWLFGGTGSDSVGNSGYLNDLWMFNPRLGTNGEWTWMGGSNMASGAISLQPGVYGTLGIAASANIPGGRASAVSWSDASGNLWLFGGFGGDSTGNYAYLNDLWMFNPKLGTNGEWAWMGGSNIGTDTIYGQPGVYGTLGIAASANTPGARYSPVSWSDTSGNLWLFGGAGYDVNGAFGHLNDLWMFDPNLGTNGEWTWMGGNNATSKPGVYGTLGMPAAANIPGSRGDIVGWTDSRGNLWLFGGGGFDADQSPGLLNDLWEYQP